MILLQLFQIAQNRVDLLAYAAQVPLSALGRVLRASFAKLVEVAR